MKRPKFSAITLLIELIIVFVGVYGAFELNRYQERQREEQIRQSYFKSFYAELLKLTAEIEASQEFINNRLKELETPPENGIKPNPRPLDLYWGSEMLITKAGFNDDVFTQLSSDLAASLSGGYDHVQAVKQMLEDFDMTCRMHLLSNEPLEFYDRSGALKEEFQWYQDGLKKLKGYFDRLAGMISEGALPATKSVLDKMK